MIYITGDTHNTIDMSNVSSRVLRKYCHLQGKDFKNISTVIVLGDFGLPWHDCPVDEEGIHPEDREEQYLLKWYRENSFYVLSLMGNHDNYNMLSKLPETEMYGGKVLKVCSNVFYLKRGCYYNIEGKSFLVLGGAQSHDIKYRTEGTDWWIQEQWTEKEQSDCLAEIKKHDCKADYVLSHTGPSEGIRCLPPDEIDSNTIKEGLEDPTVAFNDEVNSILAYKKWFFGHWHSDWGFEHHAESPYVPIYHKGIVIDYSKNDLS